MLSRKVKLVARCSLLILFILGVLYFLRYVDEEWQREKFSRKFAAEVEKTREADDLAQIRIQDLTDFAWDRVHIFTPYLTNETIDKNLGYVWQPARRIGMYQRDDIILLVFTKNGKVVFYVGISRGLGDLDGNYKEGGYSPDEAIFKVTEVGKFNDGHPHLLLKWKGSRP